MKRPIPSRFHLLCGLLLAAAARAQPSPTAVAGFDSYVTHFETARSPLQQPSGATLIEHLPTSLAAPGAMLQHWRATTFVPGVRAAELEQLLRAFDSWPQRFAPQVLLAHAVQTAPDRYLATLRVRQKHVLTVVLDSSYDVTFSPGSSTSRSTRIYELDSTGRPLADAQAHGFLWRLNTYWSYGERPGGLLIQIDSISLSRSIPPGLGWALRPYVESVPRESLEFTLNSAVRAITPR